MKPHRRTLLGLLALFQSVPLLILISIYPYWPLLGLFILWGILALFFSSFLVTRYEMKLRRVFSKKVESKIKEIEKSSVTADSSLLEALDYKTNQIDSSHEKNTLLEKSLIEKEKELQTLHFDLCQQIEQKEILLNEYRDTISSQREIIEKKQKELEETKERLSDLSNEVEVLLKLKEGDQEDMGNLFHDAEKKIASPQDKNRDDLERLLSIASHLTTAHHLAFKSFEGALALDQRRLFDRLQSENSLPLVVFSKVFDKIVFTNHQMTDLVGWGPDRFIKDFKSLLVQGAEAWELALKDLKAQCEVKLLIRGRFGEDIWVQCTLGEIPEGPFKGDIIGLFNTP